MARALQHSLHLRPLPGKLLKTLSSSSYRHRLVCTNTSAWLGPGVYGASQVSPQGNPISFLGLSSGSFWASGSFPQKTRHWSTNSGVITDNKDTDGHDSSGTAVAAFSSTARSNELDYISDDEPPSTSGSESNWSDSDDSEPVRLKTNDWRDMLQAKDRKELRAYAHAQKDNIGLHHIGKFGITPNAEVSLSDALEKNELIKVKVLSNSPEEMKQTAAQLEASLRCVCAGQVGRVLLLYRPSMKKLEKKKAQEAAAAAAAKRSGFGGDRGRGGYRGGRSGPGGRSGRSSSSRELDFSPSRRRGSSFEDNDDGGYY